MNRYTTSWIEIDQSAFTHNIDCYRRIINPSVMLGVVVKSNGYGHGLNLMGTLCQNHPAVSWLFTASLSEARALREHGVTKSILVLSIIDEDPIYACLHGIDLCVYSYESAVELNAQAQKAGQPCCVHIKIDTGLSRFGLHPDDALATILKIMTLPYLTVRGIFTHFACAAAPDMNFTHQQQKCFTQVLAQLKTNGIEIPFRHAANSPASSLVDLAGTNLVRLGAGAYGLSMGDDHYAHSQHTHPDFSLKQILNWYSKIVEVRTIPAGVPVSYDCTYVTSAETTIAIIPVGYYEGYDRRLSNKGNIFFPEQQKYAPVIGRVCMNHLIIDVSHIPSVQPGQPVLLCGNVDGIRAFDIAHTIESFNAREITTRLSQGLVRCIQKEAICPYKKTDISYTEHTEKM